MNTPPANPHASLNASRRGLIKLAALGMAGFGAPLLAQSRQGFTHGVASGEPGPDRALLWTRYVSAGETRLSWEVSESLDFTRIAASGEVLASPASDCCAKIMATGLAPGRWYYYRFTAPTGERSDIGRTRTLPVGPVDRYRIAVFSCSNYGFGLFNAYAHACEQGDFDLVLHLGDYFYEYPRGEYPSAREVLAGREMPPSEAATLATYRERFALYRGDPDLQRLHQLYPMVAMWDDHETANDTWAGGAENHQPEEGDWAIRKAASEKVYREWMPVSDDDYAAYEIGDLATLFKLESRHLARSQQLDFQAAVRGAGPEGAEAALAAFRDGAWRAADRTLLGAAQEDWLAAALRRSARAGKPWQVLGQEVVMGSLALPPMVLDGLSASAPDWLKRRLQTTVAASRIGLPYNMDAWDGYPAARDRLYAGALAADANLLVFSGDSHNAWACDLDLHGSRVGVEMAGHSVTSPGAEDTLPWAAPDALARALVERNPQLKWCDTAQRGYIAAELTRRAVTGEWRFMQTVRQRSTALAGTHRMSVLAGARRFSA